MRAPRWAGVCVAPLNAGVGHQAMDRAAYKAEAARIVAARIDALKCITFSEAAGLPDAKGEVIMVSEQKASATVFRRRNRRWFLQPACESVQHGP